jgi:hypothetical protein
MTYSQTIAGRRAHTTKFIVDGRDFFVALTDMPGVRVGMVGGTCFDVPVGHAYHDRIAESHNEATAEEYFDELMDALA